LESDEVHVWRAALNLDTPRLTRLERTLSEDEHARAERFHFPQDRQRFVAARGLLRTLLGRYLGGEPGQVLFCYGPQGKPALAGESGGETLRFNVSHSGELVLYAVSRGRELGIDIERLRPDFATEQIARRFFSAGEVAALQTLPAGEQRQAFFACWTRKEAYLKARGDGLSLDLKQFEVSLAPGKPAALLSTKHDPQEVLRWSLRDLTPGPGYVAALAVEGHDWRLRCWQWPE
jgi:4'-phosphopantetheinyl transferase